MKKLIIKILVFVVFFLSYFFASKSIYATTFDLYVSTPGPYNRGQEVTFTITINTEGATLNNTAIGMTYDTQYLEYVNTIPGNTFSTITTDNLGGGKLVFYGNSPSGYNGQGKYVDVVFKLIAQAPGETELCVLWNPQNPSPTTPNQPTSTIPPQPTKLPVSGENKYVLKYSIFGGVLTFASIFYFLKNNLRQKFRRK